MPAILDAQVNSAAYPPFQEGNYQRAIQIAENELLNNPQNIDARIVMSWSLLASGQNQNALATALDAQKRAPNDERIAAVIGEAYYQLGRYLDALEFLERYVALTPNGIAAGRVHSIMGEIFIQFSEYHHAGVAFSAATQFDPSITDWWQRAGFVYEHLSKNELAEEAYRRALQLSPDSLAIQQAITRVR